MIIASAFNLVRMGAWLMGKASYQDSYFSFYTLSTYPASSCLTPISWIRQHHHRYDDPTSIWLQYGAVDDKIDQLLELKSNRSASRRSYVVAARACEVCLAFAPWRKRSWKACIPESRSPRFWASTQRNSSRRRLTWYVALRNSPHGRRGIGNHKRVYAMKQHTRKVEKQEYHLKINAPLQYNKEAER